jgi:hypothetical protein
MSSYQTLHPLLVGNLFLLLSLDKVFAIDKKRNQLKRYFESGFLLGVGAVFYPNIYIYIFVIWLTLIILRTFNWREWFVSILGVLTPFSFYMVYLFMTDRFVQGVNKITLIISHKADLMAITGYSFFAFIFLAIVTLIILLNILSFVRIKKINTRKYFSLFFWFLLYVILMFTFYKSLGYELIVVMAIPLSIIYSMFFVEIRNKWVGEVLFALVLASIFIIIWF